MLKENYQEVLKNIQTACEKSGRSVSDVTLIAVSKTKPASSIEELYGEGHRHFGENKVQELLQKEEQLPKDINWHLIGHLQTNKVKYIVDKVSMIHSVDSLKLAEVISKEAVKRATGVDVLIEVNVAGEESKFGVQPQEALSLIEKVSVLPNIHVCGLMTIAPFVTKPEENRWVFRTLKQLSVDIAKKNIDNAGMVALSMGMTNDYAVAIEEGATHVRIGTAIFGERNYSYL